jgi:hypothetical protein
MVELITSFKEFLELFFAAFLALFLYDILKTLSMKGVNIPAFFKGGDYYYLSFLHERARELLLQGESKDYIVDVLRKEKRPYMLMDPAVFKYNNSMVLVNRVLDDSHILKKYVIQYYFTPKDCKALIEELNGNERQNTVSYLWDEILRDEYRERLTTITELCAVWHKKPFLSSRTQSDMKVSAGFNEKVIMLALKELDVVKDEASYEKYLQAMLALKDVHPSMDVVKTKANFTYYEDITPGSQIVKEVCAIIQKQLPSIK